MYVYMLHSIHVIFMWRLQNENVIAKKKENSTTTITRKIQKESTHTLWHIKGEKGSSSNSRQEMPYKIVCLHFRLPVFHFYDETQFSTENMVYARMKYLYIRHEVHAHTLTQGRKRECLLEIWSCCEWNCKYSWAGKNETDTIVQHGMYSIKIIVMLCKAVVVYFAFD